MDKARGPVNRRGNPSGVWAARNAGLRQGVAPMRRFRNVKIRKETENDPNASLSNVWREH